MALITPSWVTTRIDGAGVGVRSVAERLPAARELVPAALAPRRRELPPGRLLRRHGLRLLGPQLGDGFSGPAPPVELPQPGSRRSAAVSTGG